ncbi:Hypothetical protein SMAX5B_017830 [Scophthalmus maximus]|uniref:Uncharacterized protein n=1 Tax=Scophthalmus maximus TaxID=52904 RepID=A0A2U9BYE3_SCOMX|nr:Hypothetical protein SMAX5B_017830 [Scophthalmus maximus]
METEGGELRRVHSTSLRAKREKVQNSRTLLHEDEPLTHERRAGGGEKTVEARGAGADTVVRQVRRRTGETGRKS